MSKLVRTAAQLAKFGEAHICPGLGRLRDEVVVKGQGLKLTTATGRTYLDFTAGIGVTNLGHCHPVVSAATAKQCGEIVHMQPSIMMSEPYVRLVERLIDVFPHKSLDNVFFWNSGTEAVEASIKLARKVTGRQNFISFQGAYHGRTAGSGALTRSKPIYTQGTGPRMTGVYTTSFPYWHSLGRPLSTSEDDLVTESIHDLDMMLRQQVNAKDVAGIIIEPVQGEGGYVPCPPAFLTHLREVCDKHGILLIIDEVQTGFYRTGEYFAIDHVPGGVRPDILVFAKGVANGFPLSGIVASREMMGVCEPGSFGGTYGGNAVACAAGLAVQDVLKEGTVQVNVKKRSEQLFRALRALKEEVALRPLIAEVRGLGLMAAIEFRSASDPLTHEGLPAGAHIPHKIGARVQDYCLEKGLVVLTTSCFDTIRFIPALVVTEEEMQSAIGTISEAIRHVAKEG